ncbi:hypothetical protein PPERSA_09736 [Pseudocohnilembus persalinus]|uniref:Uncharacterized protein n=1 Tax=Pseudocohnilembus persalinus TaxID=266149 RepID=A0A0V0Q984_PSEPJ|nr:hypothetical protein PPERSA_09736 [Pseudocohnilembus persalinus]|eukprot:KRW98583.1 hypothetical protein PPERSA_09736 [Pseudocohnilembus persalinus]
MSHSQQLQSLIDKVSDIVIENKTSKNNTMNLKKYSNSKKHSLRDTQELNKREQNIQQSRTFRINSNNLENLSNNNSFQMKSLNNNDNNNKINNYNFFKQKKFENGIKGKLEDNYKSEGGINLLKYSEIDNSSCLLPMSQRNSNLNGNNFQNLLGNKKNQNQNDKQKQELKKSCVSSQNLKIRSKTNFYSNNNNQNNFNSSQNLLNNKNGSGNNGFKKFGLGDQLNKKLDKYFIRNNSLNQDEKNEIQKKNISNRYKTEVYAEQDLEDEEEQEILSQDEGDEEEICQDDKENDKNFNNIQIEGKKTSYNYKINQLKNKLLEQKQQNFNIIKQIQKNAQELDQMGEEDICDNISDKNLNNNNKNNLKENRNKNKNLIQNDNQNQKDKIDYQQKKIGSKQLKNLFEQIEIDLDTKIRSGSSSPAQEGIANDIQKSKIDQQQKEKQIQFSQEELNFQLQNKLKKQEKQQDQIQNQNQKNQKNEEDLNEEDQKLEDFFNNFKKHTIVRFDKSEDESKNNNNKYKNEIGNIRGSKQFGGSFITMHGNQQQNDKNGKEYSPRGIRVTLFQESKYGKSLLNLQNQENQLKNRFRSTTTNCLTSNLNQSQFQSQNGNNNNNNNYSNLYNQYKQQQQQLLRDRFQNYSQYQSSNNLSTRNINNNMINKNNGAKFNYLSNNYNSQNEEEKTFASTINNNINNMKQNFQLQKSSVSSSNLQSQKNCNFGKISNRNISNHSNYQSFKNEIIKEEETDQYQLQQVQFKKNSSKEDKNNNNNYKMNKINSNDLGKNQSQSQNLNLKYSYNINKHSYQSNNYQVRQQHSKTFLHNNNYNSNNNNFDISSSNYFQKKVLHKVNNQDEIQEKQQNSLEKKQETGLYTHGQGGVSFLNYKKQVENISNQDYNLNLEKNYSSRNISKINNNNNFNTNNNEAKSNNSYLQEIIQKQKEQFNKLRISEGDNQGISNLYSRRYM